MDTIIASIALGIFLLLALLGGRILFGILSRVEGYSLGYELVTSNNSALGIRYGLFLLAITISFSQIIQISEDQWLEMAKTVAIYGAIIVGLLMVSRYVNDYLILYGFDNNREVVGEKNIAVALIEGTTYIATALVMSSALPNFLDHIPLSLIWLLIGQGLLVILAFLYRRAVPGVFEALDTHNHACALSLGGLLLASGIALYTAINGPSQGWLKDFQAVGIHLGGWLAFLLAAYLAANRIMFPSSQLRKEVMTERNIAAGLLEGVIFISATLLYNFIVA